LPSAITADTITSGLDFFKLLMESINPANMIRLLHGNNYDIQEENGGAGRGHGDTSVRLNFWFFLIVYQGFYDVVGLFWVTKLFNLYNLNWWVMLSTTGELC
jgi:hypothetical protein